MASYRPEMSHARVVRESKLRETKQLNDACCDVTRRTGTNLARSDLPPPVQVKTSLMSRASSRQYLIPKKGLQRAAAATVTSKRASRGHAQLPCMMELLQCRAGGANQPPLPQQQQHSSSSAATQQRSSSRSGVILTGCGRSRRPSRLHAAESPQ